MYTLASAEARARATETLFSSLLSVYTGAGGQLKPPCSREKLSSWCWTNTMVKEPYAVLEGDEKGRSYDRRFGRRGF